MLNSPKCLYLGFSWVSLHPKIIMENIENKKYPVFKVEKKFHLIELEAA